MQHKAWFEAVNGTLNDICNVDDQHVFGGIPLVLGGDLAQSYQLFVEVVGRQLFLPVFTTRLFGVS